MHIFDRSGIAALSDLESPQWETIYHLLEREQSEFLAVEDRFRSLEYKWPRDPLHTWSRVWEYPYVYYHLRQRRSERQDGVCLRVLDLGSGVTFFPFSVARLGYHVTCVDTDPVVSIDVPRAVKFVNQGDGQVDSLRCDSMRLPFRDGELDAVYSISVLEHIPDFERTIAEVARVLKPCGLFVLTIDIDLRGDSTIGPEDYARLMRCIRDAFQHYCPMTTVHPLNILRSGSGLFPIRKHPLGEYLLKEGVRRLMGHQPSHRLPFELTVEGLVVVHSA